MIELTIVTDGDAVAEMGATIVATVLRSTLLSRPQVAIALSGGQTPRPMLERLADQPGLPWDRVSVFQVDERAVPDGHPQRNLTMIQQSLLDRVPVPAVHAMPVAGDLETGAGAYEQQLPARLDLAVLGLGADGHTASLVPGDATTTDSDHPVVVTPEYQGNRRMTLTATPLRRARHQLWLVSGADKASALRALLRNDPTIRATAAIGDADVQVVADRAAVRAPF